MNDSEKIPLFPLGLVMLPEMHLPLHIFEDRYKKLVNSCVDEKTPFGIVYYNGSTLLKHGSTVHVEQILRTYDDGRMDLLGVGGHRFYIKKIYENKPYMEADVCYYDDESDLYDGSIRDLASEALDQLKKIAVLSGKNFDPKDFESLELKRLSFLLSASDILSIEEKQENLESLSVRTRYERIITASARHIERITTTMKIQKILGDEQDISHLFN